MNKAILEQAGINCEKCLKRMLNDEELFGKILSMFPSDENFIQARMAYKERDYAKLLAATHTIKGVSANCEMNELYVATAALVKLLKGGNYTDEEIDEKYVDFEKYYYKVCDGIKKATEG